MRPKSTYREGTVFFVPLRRGGFGAGVVSRAHSSGVILVHLFGPRRETVASPDPSDLDPRAASLVLRAGDLHLLDGKWPVVGEVENWQRSRWPMPPYVRKDLLTGHLRVVRYAEDDPRIEIASEAAEHWPEGLFRDALFGAGAVERALTEVLSR